MTASERSKAALELKARKQYQVLKTKNTRGTCNGFMVYVKNGELAYVNNGVAQSFLISRNKKVVVVGVYDLELPGFSLNDFTEDCVLALKECALVYSRDPE